MLPESPDMPLRYELLSGLFMSPDIRYSALSQPKKGGCKLLAKWKFASPECLFIRFEIRPV